MWKNKELLQVLFGVVLFFFGLWSACYSFYIWPHDTMQWWTAPHIITAIIYFIVTSVISFQLIDDILG